MILQNLLDRLEDNGIDIRLESGSIKLSGSRSAIDDNTRTEVTKYKKEIVSYLSDPTNANKYDLASPQQSMWSLNQQCPQSAAYNVGVVISITGSVNVDALNTAYQVLQQRHEILRARFMESGTRAKQVVSNVPLSVLEMVKHKNDNVDGIIREYFDTSFDLEAGPVCRLKLIERKGGNDDILIFVVHHIATDFGSIELLIDDLSKLYGRACNHDEVQAVDGAGSYLDFVKAQKKYYRSGQYAEDKQFWTDELAGELPVLNIGFKPADSRRGDMAGGSCHIEWPLEKFNVIKESARHCGVTPFTYLLSVYFLLLSKYSASDEVVVGVPSTFRTQYDFRNVVGNFVNTLPVRLSAAECSTFTDWLKTVNKKILDVLEHQLYPFSEMVKDIPVNRDTTRAPVFQTMFNWTQEGPTEVTGEASKLGDVVMGLANGISGATHDITLNIRVGEKKVLCSWNYADDMGDESFVRQMASSFDFLIAQLEDCPGVDIGKLMLSPIDDFRVLARTDVTQDRTDSGLIHDRIRQQTVETPDRIAILDNEGSLTYRELDELSDSLAEVITRKSTWEGPGTVAVLMNRNRSLIATLLAVLKTGAAYVPLDTRFPPLRVKSILESARADFFIYDEEYEHYASTLHIKNATYGELLSKAERVTLASINLTAHHESQLAHVIYTSGSTGVPKGVAIEHRNTLNLFDWLQKRFGKQSFSGVLAVSSVCFDMSILEIFLPLMSGGKTILIENGMHLAESPHQHEITLINTVPSTLELMLQQDAIPPSVKTIFTAGEAMSRSLATRIYRQTSVSEIYNLYAPSEVTIHGTSSLVSRNDKERILIGKPIDGNCLYVLDKHGNPVPPGVPGEMYFSGRGVTRGYLHSPAQSADAFVPDPFSAVRGQRMYRTGDIGRYMPDGEVEYLCRRDHQVKLRGYRIEFGDIESALSRYPGVAECAVKLQKDNNQEDFLVAYIVPKEGDRFDGERIQQFLKAQLPYYMVPDYYQRLESFPKTNSGKKDRKLLPKVVVNGDNEERAGTVGDNRHSEAARLVISVWESVLNRKSVSTSVDFFKSGGHSLLAALVVSRLNKIFGISLRPQVLFNYPVLDDFIRLVIDAFSSGHYGNETFLVKNPSSRRGELSSFQKGVWFDIIREQAGQMPVDARYSSCVCIGINGELDETRLLVALKFLMRRQAALGTIFRHAGAEVICESADSGDIRYEKIKVAYEDLKKEVDHYIKQPFNLLDEPLFEAKLYEHQHGQYTLALKIHHLVCDGESLKRIVEELKSFYVNGGDSALEPLQYSYLDYTFSQKKWLETEECAKELAHWMSHLSGYGSVLALPIDNKPFGDKACGDILTSFSIPNETSGKLLDLARMLDVTPFMLFHVAYSVLLHKYSGNRQVVVGTPSSSRSHPELQNMVGMFVNILPIKIEVDGHNSFTSVLKDARSVMMSALSNSSVPYEKILGAARKNGYPDTADLVQTTFAYEYVEDNACEVDGGSWQPKAWPERVAKFDISVQMLDSNNDLTCNMVFKGDKFSEDRVRKIKDAWLNVLAEIANKPEAPIGELSLLSKEKVRELTRLRVPDAVPRETALDMFSQVLSVFPEGKALVYGAEDVTYEELSHQAQHLAAVMKDKGVRYGGRVGICMQMQIPAVVSMLAAWKLGAAYVPMDSKLPPDRLSYIYRDAGLDILITDVDSGKFGFASDIRAARFTALMGEKATSSLSGQGVSPLNIAYIIYTSGSTGTPKGVAVSHGALATLVHWHVKTYGVASESRASQMAGFGFDASVWELWPYLCCGGTIYICDKDILLDTERTRSWLEGNAIEYCFMPTALAENFLKSGGYNDLALKYLLTGGDSLTLGKPKEARFDFVNHYGPTENTVVASAAHVKSEDYSPSIGTAIGNTQIYFLDENLLPVPEGVEAQMFLAGPALAYGYVGRPALTAGSFIPNPYASGSGERLYCTGDYACLNNGVIQFRGRKDSQVKIRGFRIELGEIQHLVDQCVNVRSSLATIYRPDGDPQIVVYIVPSDALENQDALREEIEKALRSRLPAYMMPSAYMFVDAIPLNANGKVDLTALPQVQKKLCEENLYLAPTIPTEKQLANLWEGLFGHSPIGTSHNFYRLGGHSILAMTLADRIKSEMGSPCSVKMIFENPTIRELAVVIDNGGIQDASGIEALPSIKENIDEKYQPFSLTDIQQTYFVGRSNLYALGDIATQAYAEIDVNNLDRRRYEQAWNALIQRHDMLRMVVTPDHQQKILENVPAYEIPFTDLTQFNVDEAEDVLMRTRNEMSQKVAKGYDWPLFEHRITKMPNGKYRIHGIIDGLLADGWSVQILHIELMHYYLNIGHLLSPLKLCYRDYVLTEKKIKQTALYEKSKDYWLSRLDSLPGAPELPVKTDQSGNARGRFHRRAAVFNERDWERMQRYARKLEVTSSNLLLGAYAAVLANWSASNHFTLNLTLFSRLRVHPDVNAIVGDFTSLVLLEIPPARENFVRFVREIQAQLVTDLEHRHYSGIELLREKARRNADAQASVMPVVFTSGIGTTLNNDSWESIYAAASQDDLQLMEYGYTSTQTSQVWLDNSVRTQNNQLHIGWEAIDDLFEEGVLDSMFDSYCRLLRHFVENSAEPAREDMHYLPDSQLRVRKAINNTRETLPSMLLHELVEQQVENHPNAFALLSEKQSVTYRQLWSASAKVATDLANRGAGANRNIGIVMHKGWEQVVACLAVLRCGACYVPVDHSLPVARQRQLLEQAEIQCVIAQKGFDTSVASSSIDVIEIDDSVLSAEAEFTSPEAISRGDLAYIIFTSGTTGVPKGVMIDHRGAVNTILDISKKFALTHGDRILALSSLSFDLSVYDIFGPLAQGGAVVIPDRSQLNDPAAWYRLTERFDVTVYNAVPALMQLMVDYLEKNKTFYPDSLRLIMMSGDRIPVNLPDRIRARSHGKPNIYSLGGATEASIWSIYYPIGEVSKEWKSIPYGRPLANQTFHVLNNDMLPCPDWVTGELYIGGIGLAQGYWSDEKKTARSFVTHPTTGERLYRTGDLGRYMSNGDIEFLGRCDAQVKINGYRIELEEIENYLARYPGIDSAAATVHKDENGNLQLCGYITQRQEDEADLAKKLALKIDKPAVQRSHAEELKLYRPEKIFYSRIDKGSHSSFDESALGNWLGCLAQYKIEDALLPKYYYPSAGSLNPVQLYVAVNADVGDRIKRGIYYYHPVNHTLCPVPDVGLPRRRNDGEGKVFSLIFVAELGAIKPVYEMESEDFCRLEAGYMHELLVGHGRSVGLMNDLADTEDEVFRAALPLKESQRYLMCRSFRESRNQEKTWDSFRELNLLARQSYRQFLGSTDQLLDLPDILRESLSGIAREEEGLDIFLHVKESSAQLKQGIYRYSISHSSLEFLQALEAERSSYHGLNLDIFASAHFAIYFVSDIDRKNIALYNAGRIVQALMSTAEEKRLGYCPIGTMNFSPIAKKLNLPENRVLVHSVLGGAIDKSQCGTWMELNDSKPANLEQELIAYLAGHLPPYMVPSRIISLKNLPLSGNGKLARDKLPKPERSAANIVHFESPQSKTESGIADIWRSVLGSGDISVHANFFELGGNSMLLIQVHTRLEVELQRQVPIVELFKYPNIRALAMYLDGTCDKSKDDMAGIQAQAEKQRVALKRLQQRTGRSSGRGVA